MGKTWTGLRSAKNRRKHPHLRGENESGGLGVLYLVETSPPAWGKPQRRLRESSHKGNIPTCVGKTIGAQVSWSVSWKHPHLRGENSVKASELVSSPETSPPAWGKLLISRERRELAGNIPTCVGKTARFCLDCHSGYYILLKSKFLALSLRQGLAIFAYHPSLGIDLRLAEAQRDVPNDCGGRVIKGRLLPN